MAFQHAALKLAPHFLHNQSGGPADGINSKGGEQPRQCAADKHTHKHHWVGNHNAYLGEQYQNFILSRSGPSVVSQALYVAYVHHVRSKERYGGNHG